MENLDPNEFELSPQTVLQRVDKHTIAVVKIRKSRFIMSDGEKLLETASKIREKLPKTKIILRTTAPVCSKTEKMLGEAGISVEQTIF